MITRLTAIIILSCFYWQAHSQSFLKGKVYESSSDSIIRGANIFNITKNIIVQSGSDGSYSIAANENDRVVFSMSGLKPDTIIVEFHMLLTQKDITLSIQPVMLKEVTIFNSYKDDSIARRNYYQFVYDKQPGITGRNRPANGFGISLSPISYLSRESKQKRQLKKRLIKEEREAYINMSFPQEWVQRISGLRGDSLSLFMYRYRPSYSFCRETDRNEMLVYINDKLI